ncbi:HAD-IIIC family phosphatase [Clostridium sp. E02]|uniref:HAD-IIIC family phosphatase n=1 Tax=Clostridium sp. E02 TaxID=2487134 RepID=UPI000F51DFD1|nr:HAD-IIIC family phosphatase [Clostridium sp. E02]
MKKQKIKLLIWDLDNTIWNGTLTEDNVTKLNKKVKDTILEMDKRGILMSIASKNNFNQAWDKLEEFQLSEYFIYPAINWNSKSGNIKDIIKSVNIGVDTVAFVDDQAFERDEVKSELPEILCIDRKDISSIVDMPEFMPNFITDDSKLRRQMYQSDVKRNKDEDESKGPKEEFLASLNMELTLKHAEVTDLQRAEELTVRTHQLNSTGYTYNYDELKNFVGTDSHKLLIGGLIDKYGTYGKIALALLTCTEEKWILDLLLTSCRVMSRGIGTVILNLIIEQAMKSGVDLFAEFVPTDKNRIMLVTYKLAGFIEAGKNGDVIILQYDKNRQLPRRPDHIKLTIEI